MKSRSFILIAIILFSSVALIFAQRPRGERPPFGDGNRPPRPEWIEQIDVNKNGKIELEEYISASDGFFKKWDKKDKLFYLNFLVNFNFQILFIENST